jgi:glycine/D-amino acid oxidase-like deaminating enzyme
VDRAERRTGANFCVVTSRATYIADRLVITAGAWNTHLLPFLDGLVVPERQVLGWFQPHRPELFTPDMFPVFNLLVDEGRFYGFPVHGIPGFKFGKYHHLEEDVDPPDKHFLIDVHPEFPQVSFASPCSGHGFKFASVVGEVMADLADAGDTRHDIELFRLHRFPVPLDARPSHGLDDRSRRLRSQIGQRPRRRADYDRGAPSRRARLAIEQRGVDGGGRPLRGARLTRDTRDDGYRDLEPWVSTVADEDDDAIRPFW